MEKSNFQEILSIFPNLCDLNYIPVWELLFYLQYKFRLNIVNNYCFIIFLGYKIG